ncbi:MAG: c-type cytochrome [Chloroflexota bacterium]
MRQPLWIIVALLLVSCSTSSSTLTYATLPSTADAAAGQILFEHGTKNAQACSICHSVDGSAEVGPSLLGIATRAASQVAGQSADEYLFNSIVHPTEYVVQGYSGGIMPLNYAQELTPPQIRDLIAYLQTLR